MQRFGVPDGIDLARVRDYLRAEAERYTSQPVSSLYADGALALARLEHDFSASLPLEPARTPWQVIVDWRLTIGFFLLVGLCLYATLQAPQD